MIRDAVRSPARPDGPPGETRAEATAAEWARKITIPTLVLDGGASPAWIRASAAATASLLPHASGRTLPGQGHGARPEVLAPILAEFFGG